MSSDEDDRLQVYEEQIELLESMKEKLYYELSTRDEFVCRYLMSLEEKHTRLHKQNSILEERSKQFESKCMKLEARIEVLTSERDKLVEEMDVERGIWQQSLDNYKTATNELLEIRDSLEARLTEKSNENMKLLSCVSKLETELEQLKLETKQKLDNEQTSTQKINELETSLESSYSDKARLHKMLKESDEAIQIKDKKIAKQKTILDSQEFDLAVLKDELESLKSLKSSTKVNSEDQNEIIRDLESKQIEDLKRQIEEYEKLLAEYEEMTNIVHKLKKENISLKKKVQYQPRERLTMESFEPIRESNENTRPDYQRRSSLFSTLFSSVINR